MKKRLIINYRLRNNNLIYNICVSYTGLKFLIKLNTLYVFITCN